MEFLSTRAGKGASACALTLPNEKAFLACPMPQRDLQKQPNEQKTGTAGEQQPWLSKSLEIEDNGRDAGQPLNLSDEHVIDVPLDGDSIVRA
jgi:hypothetical protein